MQRFYQRRDSGKSLQPGVAGKEIVTEKTQFVVLLKMFESVETVQTLCFATTGKDPTNNINDGSGPVSRHAQQTVKSNQLL